MYALRHGNLRLATLLSVICLGLAIAGCDGDDGDDGAPGTPGAPGEPGADGSDGLSCWDLNQNGIKDPEEDLNGDGVVDVLDCNATVGQVTRIGDGTGLTEEQVYDIGQLVATIDSVDVSSPPVVEFTVVDSKGRPALGIAASAIRFTFAKLVPGDPSFNGGLPYWQSYINRTEDADGEEPDVLETAIQATNERDGTLVELGFGTYRYTFANDVTNITDPIVVEWEPALTHRVGLEIRLSANPAETVLAPFNPVKDFVPDGGVGSGVTKDIADTNNCADCHYQFQMHGGPRKSVEYCVTCHNPGSIDQDTGESVDMAYLAHSIHNGGMARERGGDSALYPYIIYGFGEDPHDYSKTTYPQENLYCETCHVESEATPDGNAFNEAATAKTCGGCHADGLVVENPDPVTGIPAYLFDHSNANVVLGVAADGTCGACHLGAIATAGPALKIHRNIEDSDRQASEAGDNFDYEIVSATNTGPGETPVITFRIDKPDGTAWDILNDEEFSDSNASLNLYVAWSSDEIYNGDELGNSGGARDQGDGNVTQPWAAGHPYRMYLAALQETAVANADGSFTVTYFTALPTEFTGDVVIGLGGHPAWNYTLNNGTTKWDRAYPVSAVFYPGTKRQTAFDSAQCNACHERLAFHGGNRVGNYEICLVCHNPDQAVDDDGLQDAWAMGVMIHSIHVASGTYAIDPASGEGSFAKVTYPQNIANCFTCHVDGAYNTARTTARAVSLDNGADPFVWTDDMAATPNTAYCGVCHTSTAARGHFLTQGGQADVPKSEIVGASVGLPNGQEACAVCHGTGSEFETSKYHNPGVELD